MNSHKTAQEDSLPNEYSFSFTIDSSQTGQRLDRFLTLSLPQYSRSELNNANKKGTILVDGKIRKSSYKLKLGESIVGYLESEEVIEIVPEKIDLEVLFEDEHLLVISKSPGLVVHPGAGNKNGTLVNGLVYHCQQIQQIGEDLTRPGIVHRLDKDTSGVMVVAKTQETHRKLSDIFKNRQVRKQYHALVHGRLAEEYGRLVAHIGRHPVHRKKMAVVEGAAGRYAVTKWELLEEFGARYSMVELEIETGRTHQIRVHMNHLGNPVVGDELYGPRKIDPIASRQLLHASNLKFVHPITGRKMNFTAPIWPDFAEILENLRKQYGEEE